MSSSGRLRERCAAVLALLAWLGLAAAVVAGSLGPALRPARGVVQAASAPLAAPGPPPDPRAALGEAVAAVRPDLPPAEVAAIAGAIAAGAASSGLDPWLLWAVIDVESGFSPAEVGAAGEVGLMQVLPSTAAAVARGSLGLDPPPPAGRLADPDWNVRVGAAYLAWLVRRYRGDLAMALSAYNAGDGVRSPTPYAAKVLAAYRDALARAGAR